MDLPYFSDVFEIDMQKDACKKAQMRIKRALGRKLFRIKIVKDDLTDKCRHSMNIPYSSAFAQTSSP